MNAGSFVLDASVALAWCFEDEASVEAIEVLERLKEGTAVVPALWFLEVGNALLNAERRGRLTPTESTTFLELLRQLPIRVEEISPRQFWEEILVLARAYHLSTYDAAYLTIAMRTGLPLATLDRSSRQAAAACGIRTI
jgi:predicted nucleic acid-binding protein